MGRKNKKKVGTTVKTDKESGSKNGNAFLRGYAITEQYQ